MTTAKIEAEQIKRELYDAMYGPISMTADKLANLKRRLFDLMYK